MFTEIQTQTVSDPSVEDFVKTLDHCLPILTNLRNRLMEQGVWSRDKAREITELNLVIMNLERAAMRIEK